MNSSDYNKYDVQADRTYLAELALPLGCDIRRKCNRCIKSHYCQYYRYSFSIPTCSCICGATCLDCRSCPECNTETNKRYARFRKFRFQWRQSPELLNELRRHFWNKRFISSGFRELWPADGLIYKKILSYLDFDV